MFFFARNVSSPLHFFQDMYKVLRSAMDSDEVGSVVSQFKDLSSRYYAQRRLYGQTLEHFYRFAWQRVPVTFYAILNHGVDSTHNWMNLPVIKHNLQLLLDSSMEQEKALSNLSEGMSTLFLDTVDIIQQSGQRNANVSQVLMEGSGFATIIVKVRWHLRMFHRKYFHV